MTNDTTPAPQAVAAGGDERPIDLSLPDDGWHSYTPDQVRDIVRQDRAAAPVERDATHCHWPDCAHGADCIDTAPQGTQTAVAWQWRSVHDLDRTWNNCGGVESYERMRSKPTDYDVRALAVIADQVARAAPPADAPRGGDAIPERLRAAIVAALREGAESIDDSAENQAGRDVANAHRELARRLKARTDEATPLAGARGEGA